MKTNLCIFISYLSILGTFSTGFARGINPPEGKQSSGAAQSPAFIYPNPVIPLPKNQGGNNNLPSQYKQVKMPEFTEEQKKCLQSFVNKGMTTCLEDIGNSFVTEKIGVRTDCCSALDGLSDECRLVIHFQNKVFMEDVRKFCVAISQGAGIEGSGAEDGPGETGFKDGSFGDTTGQLENEFGSAFGPGPAEAPGPYGSYGPSAAEGPNYFGPSEDIGPVIEGSSPTSMESSEGAEPVNEESSPSSSEPTEEVGPNNEGSAQSSDESTVEPNAEGSAQNAEVSKSGPSDGGVGHSNEPAAGSEDEGSAQSSEVNKIGHDDGGEGHNSDGPAVGSNDEGSAQSSDEAAVGPVNNENESPSTQ